MEDETWILVRVVLVFNVRFSNAIMSDMNGGLQSFQRWIKCSSYSTTHPIQADIEDNIEDRADQRRLSNAGLDRSEYISDITEGISGITDISDEDDAESVCENLLFNGHEAALHGLLTLGILREFLQPVMVIH